MKKILLACCMVAFLVTLAPSTSQAKATHEKGGPAAFVVGCCWGIREGSEWNEGAGMHWREWCRIVPFVGFVIAIWDGVECSQGIKAHDWAKQNGADWY
ncbi:MAG: hypothetical protein A3J84_09795 [Ignavibacteria bacterium RIFOXYA2_FULL_37_17]|nr:MAG: hypothetical protein A3J84_09795 [Ignavibacteria bacterium RIFOXYA2_FULL_37_17]OGV66316.1 MAG: hypothetical protein A2283_01350 [Lentisphaerae bacterium RIFOXYA12_FULL_48_11]